MGSLVLAMVKGLQALLVSRPWSVDSDSNSIHTDSPVSAYPSSNTVYPEDLSSSPSLDVQSMPEHDVPISIATVTRHLPGCNPSPDTTPDHPVPHTLFYSNHFQANSTQSSLSYLTQ
jgi:hypothetical protein